MMWIFLFLPQGFFLIKCIFLQPSPHIHPQGLGHISPPVDLIILIITLFLLLRSSRFSSPVPACLLCRLISSLDFASRFSHFLLQSETVRWICGKAVLMAWAISSQACLLSCIETPVLHFPLITPFLSCINWTRRRHSWSVQLGLRFLLDIPSISCRGIFSERGTQVDWMIDYLCVHLVLITSL